MSRNCSAGFNVANWLAATTAALELGATLDHVVEAAAQTAPGKWPDGARRPGPAVPGSRRLRAHAPGAGERPATLRPHTEGRLMVVFGHAGRARPGQSPDDGPIAAEQSDFFVISMDDPLHEDPAEIAHAIAAATAVGRVQGRISVDLDLDVRYPGRLLDRARPGDTLLPGRARPRARMLVGTSDAPGTIARRPNEPWPSAVTGHRHEGGSGLSPAVRYAVLHSDGGSSRAVRGRPLMAGLFFSRSRRTASGRRPEPETVAPIRSCSTSRFRPPRCWTSRQMRSPHPRPLRRAGRRSALLGRHHPLRIGRRPPGCTTHAGDRAGPPAASPS